MPKKARELSALEVKRSSRELGFHAVGGVAGLHLAVTSDSAASWILRVVIGENRADLGLGSYPEIGLAQARDRAREAREQIRGGIDPRQAKKAAALALRAATARALTFEAAAKACHIAKVSEFRNSKHKDDWINSLDRYAFPDLGSVPVAEIDLPHLVKVLGPIWTSKTETATRVRQRIESVLAWATVNKFRTGDNPARWKGNLEHALPKPAKVRKVAHHPALLWQEVGGFMADLRKREGMGARALEFAILTAARSGEVRGATWDEIDLKAKLWTIPAGRMKAGKQHRIPLSEPALKLLKALPRFDGSPYVFAAARGGMLSDMSLSAVTRRMGLDVVPHGFRSSFKDWCRTSTAYPDEVSELALAHVNSDATRAAYARDELLPQRQRLMTDWAKYCTTVPRTAAQVVVPIRRAKSR
ncbi:integrase arm-type DNA-binding domain-containing protein [Steroidobacter sp. S1-65]|uniref:Integrase arm-type DNA-binding domain-containing protein n=1 Tax=Steroidobacter gossypii TaxID=2805490 RepID=A0ABS1WW45_9GAMM|nr:site-specific integrase [Steroidobacter gossypii]MBM0105195.1 integrase arm-type DNA-binding domain-containing protein [Steroidobacter gossypii]